MNCSLECVHLVVNSDGLVVTRIVTGPDTPDDWNPGVGLTLLDHSIVGDVDGTYINGVYTAPPEPEDAAPPA